MALKQFNNFDRRLWLSGPKETMPRDALRRARGVQPRWARSIRSRPGSVDLFSISAHSLMRFAGSRFQGSSGEFYRSGISIKSGLNGNRLAFLRMPPTPGTIDFLFVAGGGMLFKVDQAGLVSNWGIAAPADGMTAADGGAGALSGVYKYRVTFKNTVTGHRSNANPTTVTTASLTNRAVLLSSIPTSSDLQVDAREIWRTVTNGSVFFLLTTIFGNTITTLTDNIVDANLSPTQLPTDNLPPDATFFDVAGPHAGRAWWLDSTAGKRGRILYSPIGRPESIVGFIEPTNDDDPMQKIVSWGGSLWGFSATHLFQILGDDEPFVFVEVSGAQGTGSPHTVTPTRIGIMYQSEDVMLFDGARSNPFAHDAIHPIFHGETVENISSFSGIVATETENEYVISDGSQTLAVDLTEGTWRDLGIGCSALFYERDTKSFIASFASKVRRLEVQGQISDGGTPIPFEVESPGEQIGFEQEGIVQMVIIDAITNGQTLTPRLILDDVETVLAAVNTASRQRVEYPIGKKGKIVSVRLTGSLSDKVEVFSIGIEHVAGVPALARA
jgi:hypothetical protein